MIFVIAGWKFDELIKKIDEISHRLKEPVVAQIGESKYRPRNIKWFRFHAPLHKFYKKADIVISHHGAGTIFEVLGHKKKLICLENPSIVHNPDLANELHRLGYLINCKSIDNLENCIKAVRTHKFKRYNSPECRIDEKIIEFLGENV